MKGLARECWLGVASPHESAEVLTRLMERDKNGTSQVEEEFKKKNGAQPCFCPLRKFHYISAPPTHALKVVICVGLGLLKLLLLCRPSE